MKVTFVSTFFPPYIYGGAEISTSLLIKQLKKTLSVSVLSSRLQANNWKHDDIEVQPVFYLIDLGKRSLKDILRYGIYLLVMPWLNGWLLFRHLKKNPADVVHIVPSSYHQVGMIIALTWLRQPTVIDIRDFTWVCVSDFSYQGAQEEKSHSCFDHLNTMYHTSKLLKPIFLLVAFFEVCLFTLYTALIRYLVNRHHYVQLSAISEYTKEKLVSSDFVESKMTVISNLLSASPSTPLVREKKFVFAGRLEKPKGIWEIIRAFQFANLQDFTLEVYGDGSELEPLQKYIQKTNVQNIVLHGKQPPSTVLKGYKTSHAIVSYSIRPEPLGRYILDAFLTKTPLILSQLGGATEFIEQERQGLLVPANDVPALTQAMQRMADDRKLYKEITKNLEHLPKKIEMNHILDQRLSLYKKVTS